MPLNVLFSKELGDHTAGFLPLQTIDRLNHILDQR